jgi:hypothetical protein
MADKLISDLTNAAPTLASVGEHQTGAAPTLNHTYAQLATLLFPSGVGSPEGVVTGIVGMEYTDLTSTTNPGLWRKTTGSGNTGWVEVIAAGP